jgi:alkanesulfonate monooxygenase SsuD/methylene tetrahydromethanopterin reductase-like flavin-dependent oxidoreductase (luciferase family)
MRLGVTLPHIGPLAGPEGVRQAAQHAESLGYDSVRVADRLSWARELMA